MDRRVIDQHILQVLQKTSARAFYYSEVGTLTRNDDQKGKINQPPFYTRAEETAMEGERIIPCVKSR